MSVADPCPSFPGAAVCDRVRALLDAAGYREDALRRRLEGGDLGRTDPSRRWSLRRRIESLEGRLGVLLRCFHLGRELPCDEAEAALGGIAVADLQAAGLLARADGAYRPTVQLSAVGELVIASDLPSLHRPGNDGFVVGPFAVTRNLAAFALRHGVDSALDLGCGGGALAALAAARAGHVVASDVNPRAVAFARFNIELNGIGNVEVREGSLFETVPGERFDLILCNPPYVLSPARTFLYRDGGTRLCRQIVSEAPGHLTGNGYLQMMVEWPERDGAHWTAEVRSWVDASDCDAWLLRLYSLEAGEYARFWAQREHVGEPSPDGLLEAWLDHLATQGAVSVGGGLLVMRRSPPGARQAVRTLRDAPPLEFTDLGDCLADWIRAQSLVSATVDASNLLDLPLRPARGLESVQTRALAAAGWSAPRRRLRIARGLRFGADVDPLCEALVGELDGVRTPRQALERVAARHGLQAAPLLETLPAALARLLDIGLLLPPPEDVDGPDADPARTNQPRRSRPGSPGGAGR